MRFPTEQVSFELVFDRREKKKVLLGWPENAGWWLSSQPAVKWLRSGVREFWHLTVHMYKALWNPRGAQIPHSDTQPHSRGEWHQRHEQESRMGGTSPPSLLTPEEGKRGTTFCQLLVSMSLGAQGVSHHNPSLSRPSQPPVGGRVQIVDQTPHSEFRRFGFQCFLFHLLAVWTWANHNFSESVSSFVKQR